MQDLESRFAVYSTILMNIEWLTLFFLLLIVGTVLLNVVGKKWQDFKENLANIAILLGTEALNKTFYGAIFVIGLYVFERLAIFDIPINLSTWIVAIISADFLYYWMHRFEHEIRILWTLHSVHHSSESFDLSTSLRLSWLEGAIEWIFLLPMILLGFDLVQTLLAFIFIIVYQSWIHTKWVPKLGVLDKIFNTPSVHRVHHGSNRIYLDKNYGGVLMVWDHLFGSYQAETEPVKYGLTTAINTKNPLKIVFYECIVLWQDCKKAQSFKQIIKHLVKGPGWRPETVLEAKAEIRTKLKVSKNQKNS